MRGCLKKTNKYFFFPEYFYHEITLLIFWDWLIWKKYFNCAKIFVLRRFKMLKNQTAGKELCHQIIGGREVQTMWYLQNIVWRTMFEGKKKFANKSQSVRDWVKENSSWSKNVQTLRYRKISRHTYIFLVNFATINSDSFCYILKRNPPYLMNDPRTQTETHSWLD